MPHYERPLDVTWVKSDGTQIPNQYSTFAALGVGTYFGELGGEGGSLTSFQLSWNAAFGGTIQIETTNYPDVSTFDGTATGWFKDAPPLVTVTAGTAGTNIQHLGFSGALRMRVRLTVTTPGEVRGRSHNKA